MRENHSVAVYFVPPIVYKAVLHNILGLEKFLLAMLALGRLSIKFNKH